MWQMGLPSLTVLSSLSAKAVKYGREKATGSRALSLMMPLNHPAQPMLSTYHVPRATPGTETPGAVEGAHRSGELNHAGALHRHPEGLGEQKGLTHKNSARKIPEEENATSFRDYGGNTDTDDGLPNIP